MAAGAWLRYPSSQVFPVSADLSLRRRYLASGGERHALRLWQQRQQHQRGG